jgi:hypothetical protein
VKRYGEEYWLKVMKAQGESGLSAAKFCRKRNLSRSTFLRWRSRLLEEIQDRGFVEIGEERHVAACSPGMVIEIAADGTVRIQVPTGGDAREIVALVSGIRNAI